MKNIVLITSDFFDNGADDSFILPEIPYLTKDNKLTLISMQHKKVRKQERDGYSFFSLPKSNFLNFIFSAFVCLFSTLFWTEISNARKDKKLTLKLFLLAIYAVARARCLKRLIKKNNLVNDSTILYSYWNVPEIVLAFVFLQKDKKADIVCVSRAHRGDIYEFFNKYDYLLFKTQMLKYLDKVFFISQNGFDYYVQKYPEYKEKYALSRLGIQNKSSQTYGSKDDVFRIVSCSYLVGVKNVDRIIKALSYLDFPVEWTHFGSGPLEKELTQTAQTLLGENKNIRYIFAGSVKNSELLQNYKETPYDLFINLSSSEGIPVSIMEAMSFGIPALATNVGGTAEIVNDTNGMLIELATPDLEICENIKKFKNLNSSEKNLFRSNARLTWEQKFNSEKNFEGFVELLCGIRK